MTMRIRPAIASAAALILLCSCGGTETSTADSVDPSKLDSGNYPTTPVDVETLRTPTSGELREALNIATNTPIPFEYDPRFGYGSFDNRKQFVTSETPPEFSDSGIGSRQFTKEVPGLVAGWYVLGYRRALPDLGRGIETYTLRFETPELARLAAQKLTAGSPGIPIQIDGHPDAISKTTPLEPFHTATVRAWLPHEDMLLYIQVADPVSRPFDPVDSAAIAKRFLDAQVDRLKSYKRTPLAEVRNLPLDIDGMLSRTLPDSEPNSRTAVYPIRAAISMAKEPFTYGPAYTDAGVDYIVSRGGAFVYRTRDEAAAARLSNAFDKKNKDDSGLLAADPPPNLPTAQCYAVDPNAKITKNTPPSCRIVVGRYVARIGGANLQDTYQRTAAQYKLLVGAK
ncbi:hypothetical protein [Nocardia sp. MH4]|uniref:DUF7373 family lipoprotein n=1 Tax=Nocardia sp. MH4 TaxID=1768677 RepID=UPI001C4F86B7|nr:hypothetical protein [Nocardia sp. MH4]